ncbi:MAG: hypothetical protein JWN37_9 [Candidatus Nomurabacteria bacterium]|nr:hypothetical protein [Candidatus Nomurabacteria bacterium]
MRKISKFRKNIFIYSAVLILIIIGFSYFVFSNQNVKPSFPSSDIEPMMVPSLTDHYKWKSNSIYTIVNYFSMDCPSCRRGDEMENKFKEDYQKHFNLIYRHSPLPDIQPESAGRAAIAECVFEQSGDEGMFNFISDFYKSYNDLRKDNDWVLNIADKYVNDTKTMRECSVSERMKEKISEDKKLSLAYGVNGTPTLGVFKNGILEVRFDTINDQFMKRIMDSVKNIHLSGN